MERMDLSLLTEEEKLERKRQQKREAQKRYYEKNKEKYRQYGNDYYMDMKRENKKLKARIEELEKQVDLLDGQVMDLEEDCSNYANELETYCSYEDEVDNIMQSIGEFMFKLKLDKCYTKELAEFISQYGGELFN